VTAAPTAGLAAPKRRRVAFFPRHSSLATERRLLVAIRAAAFAGDHVAAAQLILLGRDEREAKAKRKKMDAKMQRARLARAAKAGAKVEETPQTE
jgi:hypothetical protein